jgi:hypothetical protein
MVPVGPLVSPISIFQILVKIVNVCNFNLHFLSAGYDVCTTIGSLSKSHISLVGKNDIKFFQNYSFCIDVSN